MSSVPGVYAADWPVTSQLDDQLNGVHSTVTHQRAIDILFIRKVDKEINELMQAALYIPCIELYESTLPLRCQLYGAQHPQYLRATQQLVILYNSISMSCMNDEQVHQCIAYLQRAEQLSAGSACSTLTLQRIQTLNNLACCYKRLNRCNTARELLKEALAIILLHGEPFNDADNSLYNDARASTHLNMCALLSQLSQHDQAVEHARAAILHCQKSLLHNVAHSPPITDTVYERTVTLAIAYHNLAVEEEHLHNYGRALEWYQKALKLAQQHLPDNTQLISNFTASYHAVQTVTLHNAAALTKLTHKQQRNLLTAYKTTG